MAKRNTGEIISLLKILDLMIIHTNYISKKHYGALTYSDNAKYQKSLGFLCNNPKLDMWMRSILLWGKIFD